MLSFPLLFSKKTAPDTYSKDLFNLKIPKRIRWVIFDADGTLTSSGGFAVLEPASLERIVNLVGRRRCCILSNEAGNFTDDRGRARRLEEDAGIKVIRSRFKKPDVRAVMKAIAYLQATPEETMIVGDRLLTDVLAGNRVGCFTALVDPPKNALEPWLISLVRGIERCVQFRRLPKR